jgi:DNA-binding MarR family transcriptional regulator
MSSERREALLAELTAETRRYLAAYVLYNQAAAGCLGIHPTDLQCLNLLSLEPEPLTTGQIAELTGLTTGSATRLVDRMERAGYVTRQRDPRDRRRVFVVLAPERTARIREFFQTRGRDFTDLRDELTVDEILAVTSFLRRHREVSQAQVAALNGCPKVPRPTDS